MTIFFDHDIRMASVGVEKKAIEFENVKDAATRIGPFINLTPVLTCSTLDRMAGKSLYFKCENFQKGGAFKFRGAMNAVLKLTEDKSTGELPAVVTHSSGNHAQALALAARIKGLKAHIVMPNNAPAVKKAAVKDYGARIIECGVSQQNREEAATRTLKETGPNSYLIPPYDHKDIIAGQGTMALELLEQVPDLDAIVVPVGGGGMLSGICVAAKGLKPSIKIFAAEPLEANDCAKSFAAGERIPLPGVEIPPTQLQPQVTPVTLPEQYSQIVFDLETSSRGHDTEILQIAATHGVEIPPTQLQPQVTPVTLPEQYSQIVFDLETSSRGHDTEILQIAATHGPPATVADGLKTSLGFLTWPIIRDNIEDVITVTESEIITAMRLVWERMKVVIEPSAAVGVAAVLNDKFRAEKTGSIAKVGIILCGGNVNLDNLPWNK
ncbi:hypothetical protein QZH41_014764 [Actinostola sp. cb2023]|nr:hypothetical protein QZH41_014764 [Actinostola sp. cb2023]